MTVLQLVSELLKQPANARVEVTVGGVPNAPLIGVVDAVTSDEDVVFISASEVA